MKKLIICICSYSLAFEPVLAEETPFNKTHECILEAIQDETCRIDEIEASQRFDSELCAELLEIYNERGISYFAMKSYESALADFNHILNVSSSLNHMEELIVGSAAFGRMLCHACLDMTEEMLQDIDFLDRYFRVQFQKNCYKSRENDVTFSFSRHKLNLAVFPAAQFANPNEQISADACRERVRGSARTLKLFIGPLIKDVSKRAIFFTFIDGLENKGLYCCKDGSIWTTCVSPILDKLEKWKIIGIPADPYWD